MLLNSAEQRIHAAHRIIHRAESSREGGYPSAACSQSETSIGLLKAAEFTERKKQKTNNSATREM